jgi:hypothetical protein
MTSWLHNNDYNICFQNTQAVLSQAQQSLEDSGHLQGYHGRGLKKHQALARHWRHRIAAKKNLPV